MSEEEPTASGFSFLSTSTNSILDVGNSDGTALFALFNKSVCNSCFCSGDMFGGLEVTEDTPVEVGFSFMKDSSGAAESKEESAFSFLQSAPTGVDESVADAALDSSTVASLARVASEKPIVASGFSFLQQPEAPSSTFSFMEQQLVHLKSSLSYFLII